MKLTLWIITGLLTMVVLFYSFEGWRGARAWSETKAWLEEEGEPLEFSELRPAPVPEADNFFGIPLLASLIDFETIDGEIVYAEPELRERFLEMRLPEPTYGKKAPQLPDAIALRPLDAKAWAAFLTEAEEFDTGDLSASPEAQIATALSRFDEEIAEIAEAATTRPHALVSLQLGDTFIELVSVQLPHLFEVLKFSRLLTVKGAAAAAAGDGATARDCILIQMRLGEALGAEPILIQHLVESSIITQAVTVVREGLLARCWDDTDLEWIAEKLESTDLCKRGVNALRGEMLGFFVTGTKTLKEVSPDQWASLIDQSSGQLAALGFRLIPDGWFDQNAATGVNLMYRHSILPMKTRDFSGSPVGSIAKGLGSTTPYNFVAKKLVPAMSSVARKTAQAQALLDSARIACALERYHLANQDYPDTLDQLKPQFLSAIALDPASNAPLIFKPESDGYRIYSIGLNGIDEGGALFRNAAGKADRDRGDWVFAVERVSE